MAGAGTPALFPELLHLTRTVEDPLAHGTTTIEEYCSGNRVVSVVGPRTVIVDYDRREITDIRRDRLTYSITTFEEAARSTESGKMSSSPAAALKNDDWLFTAVSSRTEGTEYVDVQPKHKGSVKSMRLGVDRSVRLSKDAVEVLAGGAYPRSASDESRLTLRAASPGSGVTRMASQATGSSGPGATYGLPVEQSSSYDFEGKEIVFRVLVTKIAHDAPGPEILTIPPGARRVESHALQVMRELDALDHLPAAARQK